MLKKGGENQVFIGNINNHKSSTLYLVESPTGLSGHILLVDEKKVYNYITRNNSVYLQETDINRIICIDYSEQPPSSSLPYSQNNIAITVPNLQSLPGATAVVLLDFDGQYVVNSNWNGGNPINAAPANFSESSIIETWKLISEDFRPFDLNITKYWNGFSLKYLNYKKKKKKRSILFTK